MRVRSAVLQCAAGPDPDVEVGVYVGLLLQHWDCEGGGDEAVGGEVCGDGGAEGEFFGVGGECC